MTERMQNALRHIETSCDVDQWAIDTVREIFADNPIEIKVFANEYKVHLKMDGMFIYIENTNLIKHSEIG